MNKKLASFLVAAFAALLIGQSAHATNGSWNVDAAGNWSLASNWLSSIIADGAGATGNFTFNITASRIITIDGAVASRTLGIMNIGDSVGGPSNYTIAASGGGTLTFDNSGSNAQINETSTSGNNTISAPILLKSSLDISNASANLLTLSGGITSSATTGTQTISLLSGNATISGIIGNGVTGGTVAVTQSGAGTLALGTTVNTYTGDTTISGGKITIGSSGTNLGSGNLILSGGTLVITADRGTTTNSIANAVSVTANSAITTTSAAANPQVNFTGGLAGTGGTLTFRNDAASTTGIFDPRFTGGDFTMNQAIVIDNGAGGGTTRLSDFNISGTTHTYNGNISGNGSYRRSVTSGAGGTTIFSGTNSYTGATSVFAGTLLVNGNDSTAIGAVSVINNASTSAATLGGIGTIGGAVTVGSGAAAGTITGATNGTIGTLNLSSTATFLGATSNLATYLVDIGGLTSDKLAIAGALSLSGAFDQISFNQLSTLTGTSYTLATYASETGTFDTVTSLPTGYSLVYNPTELDLVLTAVPEPSTWLAGALVAASLLVTQRRRFSRRAKVVA